jgi:hypothetical protein
MSGKITTWAWTLRFDIPSHKLVMLSLADHADPTGLCYPFIETIAKHVCLKESQVRKIIRYLEQKNYISSEPRFKRNHQQSSNCYQVNYKNSFPTIDDSNENLSTGVYSRIAPPCTVGYPPPVLQDSPPPFRISEKDNENNILTKGSNSVTKSFITKNITKNYCSSEDELGSFELFWNNYPRKQKKKDALKIWRKNKLYENHKLIVEDVQKRTELNWKHKSKEFIPLPSSYLNGERWSDEIIDFIKEQKIVKEVPKPSLARQQLGEDRPKMRDFTQERLDREEAELKRQGLSPNEQHSFSETNHQNNNPETSRNNIRRNSVQKIEGYLF